MCYNKLVSKARKKWLQLSTSSTTPVMEMLLLEDNIISMKSNPTNVKDVCHTLVY